MTIADLQDCLEAMIKRSPKYFDKESEEIILRAILKLSDYIDKDIIL